MAARVAAAWPRLCMPLLTRPFAIRWQMRIVKQRLQEMMPGIEVFLDVDDLEDIGDLPKYIQRSKTILIFCSSGCAIEPGSRAHEHCW